MEGFWVQYPPLLSIISVPIGNLGDITVRARETLGGCDAIVCEDTRVTGHLLQLLGLPKKELISFHGYSDPGKVKVLIARLKGGQHLALVADAGTPCISDPGFALVAAAHRARIATQVIPGPAAFLAALSVSGLPINRFTYLGFPPLKHGRQTWFREIAAQVHTVVFYESVHRIGKTLATLGEVLEADRPVVIARELTKLHEEVIETTAGALPEIAKELTEKGEFVIVVGPRSR